MVWINAIKIRHMLPRVDLRPGSSLAAFSLHCMASSYPFRCLACIPVAPAAHTFFNPLTTLHTSESVGKSSGIAKEGKFYGRGGPKGGALA